MEALAPELLAAITDELATPELVNLLAASPSFTGHIEPILFGSPARREATLWWACAHGNHDILRRALAHGSSISIIEPFLPKKVPVLTLFVAAKHNQPATFSLLQDLGAGIPSRKGDHFSIGLQAKYIMRWLARKPNLGLLQAFLDKGLDAAVKALHLPVIAWPLVWAISSGASATLVQTLLDRGASPNMLVPGSRRPKIPLTRQTLGLRHPGLLHRELLSPLSVAIGAGSQETVRQLLAAGADIHGHPSTEAVHTPLGHLPTHLPIFAATVLLAHAGPGQSGRGAEAMLTLCLENGADINQRACFDSHSTGFCFITPLPAFIEAVPTWTEDALQRLHLLIEKGAVQPSPKDEAPPAVASRVRELYGDSLNPWPSALEALLDLHGIAALQNDHLLSAAQLLAQLPTLTSSDNIKRLLLRADWMQNVGDAPEGAICAQWCKLLDVLVARLKASSIKVDAILAVFIMDFVRARRAVIPPYILHATIDRLIDVHGANINAPFGNQGQTILYEACRDWCTRAHEPWDNLSSPQFAEPRLSLFENLLRRGADPTSAPEAGPDQPFRYDTVLEMLQAGCKVAHSRHKNFMMRLVTIVQNRSDL